MTMSMGGYAHEHATLAYQVSNDDGHSVIAWGRNYGEARRFGAELLELSFDEVDCERYPKLDGFTGDLLTWMLDHGWHFECSECQAYCDSAQHYRDDRDDLYCSEACCHQHRAYWDARAALEGEFEKFARVKYFGAIISRCSVNVEGDGIVYLEFPKSLSDSSDAYRSHCQIIARSELGA